MLRLGSSACSLLIFSLSWILSSVNFILCEDINKKWIIEINFESWTNFHLLCCHFFENVANFDTMSLVYQELIRSNKSCSRNELVARQSVTVTEVQVKFFFNVNAKRTSGFRRLIGDVALAQIWILIIGLKSLNLGPRSGLKNRVEPLCHKNSSWNLSWFM